MEEQTKVDDAKMTTRQKAADMVERLRRGEKMAEILDLRSSTVANLEAQVFRLYRNGLFSRAKTAGRGVLALDEDRPLMHLVLGDIALEEYRFSEAVKYLRRADELAPDKPVIRARLGEALLKDGEVREARSHLEAVIDAGAEVGADDRRRCQVLLRAVDE